MHHRFSVSDRNAILITGALGAFMIGAATLVSLLRTHSFLEEEIWMLVILFIPLLALIWSDLRTYTLPDGITLTLMGAGLVFHGLRLQGPPWTYLLGAMAGYLLILGLRQVFRMAKGIEAVGMGDAKLLAAGGAWLGFFTLPFLTLMASLIGLIVALIAVLIQRKEKKLTNFAIPFGVPLALAVWGGVFVQVRI